MQRKNTIVKSFTLIDCQAKSTIFASQTLKGIAITSVIVNHYLNYYVTGNNGGFANVIVSFFFLLSGYGIFSSLQKRFDECFSFNHLISFYHDRIFRIFPLFWLALYLQGLLTNKSYPIWSFIGWEADGHYWFISAIIQCYLFSPIFVFFLGYNKHLAFIAIAVVFSAINAIGNQSQYASNVLDLLDLTKSPYLGIYFLHTFIFFIGMYFKSFEPMMKQSKLESKISSKVHYVIFIFLIFLILVYMIINKYYFNLGLSGNLGLLIILFAYAMRNYIGIIGFSFLGKISFSLYLFHMSYLIYLEQIGWLKKDSLSGLLATIILLPFFILLSMYLENFGNYLSKKTRKKIG
jgi:peptidoglycan/LPS O-acetylase OafA/YrhL